MSRKPRKQRDPELFDVEAGKRMAVFFERARVEFGLSTDADLWRKLGIGRDTAQAWMRGERPPSRASGSGVAAKLGIRYDDLLAVYEGRSPQEVDTATVIAALEYAIRLVRAGRTPDAGVGDDVREAEDALRRRRRTPASPPRGRPTGARG